MADKEVLLSKIHELKEVLSRDPKSVKFVQLSESYRQLGQLDDALEVSLRGTWELPQFADGYVAVGRVYFQRQVLGKAEESFYKALSVDQMCIPAYKGLARLHKEQGDIQKASDILTKAIMLDPGDLSLQKMIESLGNLDADAHITPDNPPNTPEPVAQQEPAMEMTSDGMKPITTATIADIYIEQGFYDKALDVYRDLLNKNPNDLSVQQKISELEVLMNSGVAQSASPTVSPAPVEPALSEETAAPSSDNGALIDKLSRWLEAIQARRNRV